MFYISEVLMYIIESIRIGPSGFFSLEQHLPSADIHPTVRYLAALVSVNDRLNLEMYPFKEKGNADFERSSKLRARANVIFMESVLRRFVPSVFFHRKDRDSAWILFCSCDWFAVFEI